MKIYKRLCKTCKRTKSISRFPIVYRRLSRTYRRKICKLCIKPVINQLKIKKRAYYREAENRYYKTVKGKFNYYKKNARKREIVFNLSITEFSEFLGKECSYCGTSNSYGIDREDCSLPYQIGNVASCCTVCNWMKGNKLPVEFINQCKKVIDYRNSLIPDPT